MLHIETVNPADYMPDIRAMLADNWAETGFDFAFDPDVDAYQRMFDAGLVFALAAYHDDFMVGYCTVTVVPHPYNKSVVIASNDALFVHSAVRNGLTSGRLMKAAEAEAKRRGAHKFTWHCRAGTPLAEMLVSHGYEPVDVVVARSL